VQIQSQSPRLDHTRSPTFYLDVFNEKLG